MVLFLAGSVGTYFFYQHKRAQDHVQAEAILATVEASSGRQTRRPRRDAEKELAQALAARVPQPARRPRLDA